MRLSTLAVPVSAALALVACSHKETVVERPVVEKQTVIERQVPAAGATAPGSCSWNSVTYSDGSMSCQAGKQFRCSNGTWNQAAGSC
jgi:hypothetical protein